MTGIFIVDMGINVVHLMPVQEFLHYPDDEWQKAFKDDPYIIDQYGINYLDIHDNWALADRFAVSNRDGRYSVDEKAYTARYSGLQKYLKTVIIPGLNRPIACCWAISPVTA